MRAVRDSRKGSLETKGYQRTARNLRRLHVILVKEDLGAGLGEWGLRFINSAPVTWLQRGGIYTLSDTKPLRSLGFARTHLAEGSQGAPWEQTIPELGIAATGQGTVTLYFPAREQVGHGAHSAGSEDGQTKQQCFQCGGEQYQTPIPPPSKSWSKR